MSETPSAPAAPEPEGPAPRARAATEAGPLGAESAQGRRTGAQGGRARTAYRAGPPPAVPGRIGFGPTNPRHPHRDPVGRPGHRSSSARFCWATDWRSEPAGRGGARRPRRVLRRPRGGPPTPRPGRSSGAVGGVALLAVPGAAGRRLADVPRRRHRARGGLARPARRPHLARRPARLARPVRSLGHRHRPGHGRDCASGRAASRAAGAPCVRAVAWPRCCSSSSARCSPGADAAFADLLGGLMPDVSVADGPWRFLLSRARAWSGRSRRPAPRPPRCAGTASQVRPGRARGRCRVGAAARRARSCSSPSSTPSSSPCSSAATTRC